MGHKRGIYSSIVGSEFMIKTKKQQRKKGPEQVSKSDNSNYLLVYDIMLKSLL
jgi:hypothetical protein